MILTIRFINKNIILIYVIFYNNLDGLKIKVLANENRERN